jgi:hypothetical protein
VGELHRAIVDYVAQTPLLPPAVRAHVRALAAATGESDLVRLDAPTLSVARAPPPRWWLAPAQPGPLDPDALVAGAALPCVCVCVFMCLHTRTCRRPLHAL